MKKTIYVCDRCGKEVDWVYSMPRLILEGLKISLYNDPKSELCKGCAEYVISEYRRMAHEKATEK